MAHFSRTCLSYISNTLAVRRCCLSPAFSILQPVQQLESFGCHSLGRRCPDKFSNRNLGIVSSPFTGMNTSTVQKPFGTQLRRSAQRPRWLLSRAAVGVPVSLMGISRMVPSRPVTVRCSVLPHGVRIVRQ